MKGNLYIVATGQHVGKTTVSLGIMLTLVERGYRVHFMKPVGQQTVVSQGIEVDKDALLVHSVLDLDTPLKETNPVQIPRGYVENYIFNRDPEPQKRRIVSAYDKLKKDCDVLVIEGTGHAGVGSCFDLSNADVAALIGASTLLVVEGGIGSTLDQVALNHSLFKEKGVEILGVVANKVWPEKRDRIERALERGLSNMGLRLLGAVPFDATLTYPRVVDIARALKAETICGKQFTGIHIENVLVAAMEPQNVLTRIRPHSLMITPGDRIDNILLALNSGVLRGTEEARVVAILLTGGLVPDRSVLSLVEASGMPLLVSEQDTYPVSASVEKMIFKIQPEEKDKIHHAHELVRRYVDIDSIISELTGS